MTITSPITAASAHSPPADAPDDQRTAPRSGTHRCSYVLGAVRAVVGDAVLDDAAIVVRDGMIVEVTDDSCRRSHDIDGTGLTCMPGVVDTHSRSVELAIRQRRGAESDHDLALRSFEGTARAAGVTTVFHAIDFDDGGVDDRTTEDAEHLCDVVAQRSATPDSLVDHQVVHRLDVRDPDGLGALAHRLRAAHEVMSPRTPLVSYVRSMSEITASRGAGEHHIESALDWLAERARAGLIRLMAHEPTSADDIDDAVERSVVIAEFPTSLDAARRARERGLRTVCSGPDVLRDPNRARSADVGGMIERGVCDGLASDDVPFSLLGAVGSLVHDGVCTLATAVGLVTSGPAETVGLHDRGRLAPGMRSDLVLVDFTSRLPTVHAVLRPEDRLTTNRNASAEM